MQDKTLLALVLVFAYCLNASAEETMAAKRAESLAPDFLEFLEMTDTDDDIWPVLLDEKPITQLGEKLVPVANKDSKATNTFETKLLRTEIQENKQ